MLERTRAGVLITRPEPAARETACLLEWLGFTPVLAPMIEIATQPWVRPAPPAQAVLVTSANALPALQGLPLDLRLFAVGDATAARARSQGFLNIASAGRDARALADLVAGRCDPAAGPLLLASGAGLGLDLAADMRKRGFGVIRRVAYRARAVTMLPDAAAQALGTGAIRHALFYSAASARAFVACITHAANRLDGVEALAISHPTARALAPLPWLRIRVASHPNQDELVALLT